MPLSQWCCSVLIFLCPRIWIKFTPLGTLRVIRTDSDQLGKETLKKIFSLYLKWFLYILDISIIVEWYQVGKKFWQLLGRLLEIIKTEIPPSQLFCYPETFSIKTLSFIRSESTYSRKIWESFQSLKSSLSCIICTILVNKDFVQSLRELRHGYHDVFFSCSLCTGLLILKSMLLSWLKAFKFIYYYCMILYYYLFQMCRALQASRWWWASPPAQWSSPGRRPWTSTTAPWGSTSSRWPATLNSVTHIIML